MAPVLVPKGIFYPLCAGLGVSLLALAFFVGRESTRSKEAIEVDAHEATAVHVRAAEPVSPVRGVDPPTRELERLPLPQEQWEPVPPPSVPTMTRTAATAVPTIPEPSPTFAAAPVLTLNPEREAVARYLAQIDKLSPGSLGEDKNAYANSLVSSAMGGDTSAFDGLIQQVEAGQGKLTALSPPPSCSTFHQHVLASFKDSVEFLRTTRKVLQSKNIDELSSLQGNAQEIQQRAEALASEEKALRKAFQIAE